ncbi:hypothetical protein GB937_005350 [Aspergillus fischeri]|nr:hypothetical protein GB937_005350 [Aspergillus fischeri]
MNISAGEVVMPFYYGEYTALVYAVRGIALQLGLSRQQVYSYAALVSLTPNPRIDLRGHG